MCDFKKLTLSDKPWVDALLRESGFRGCEYSFSCAMMWSGVYDLAAAEVCGRFVLSSRHFGQISYLFPAGGGELAACVRALRAHSAREGAPLRFYSATDENRQSLEALFPGEFTFTPQPDAAEYLYDAESLRTLGGKKLHAKRNHINRFTETHPDWTFDPIGPGNLEECRAMNERWRALYEPEGGKSLRHETCAVQIAFEHFFDFGLQGGLIKTGGEVVAYAMGERLCADTYNVRIEKAFSDIQGAYALINREFARAFCTDVTYINREDDAGDPGLRKAKLSYRPIRMLEKFSAVSG